MSAGLFQLLLAGSKNFPPAVSIGNVFNSSGGRSSVTLTTTAAIPAGSVVVVGVCSVSNGAVTSSTVSDGTNTYTQACQIQTATNVIQSSLWYKLNASAVSSGATITVNFSGASGGDESGLCAAYIVGPTALDIHTTSSGSSTTTFTIASGALAGSPSIAFGTSQDSGPASTTYTGASGFTTLGNPATVLNQSMAFDYQNNILTTSTFNYSPVWANSGALSGCLATFK